MKRWRLRWKPGWPADAPERVLVVDDFALRIGRGSGAFTIGPSELLELASEEGGGRGDVGVPSSVRQAAEREKASPSEPGEPS